MKTLRYLIPGALFAVLCVFLWRGLDPHRDPQALPSPLINQAAPPLRLPTLFDPSTQWDAHSMRGQVWLLNVFASWCRPCLEEHAHLHQLARQRGIPVIGLNYKDAPADAQAWLARHGNPYQQVVTDPSGQVAIDYGVYGVPETFLIDRAGIIRLRYAGALTPSVINQIIQPHLQALP